MDADTGIRFGVIGQNHESLNPDAVQDIWQHGTDLAFENYQTEVKQSIRNALSDYFSDMQWKDGTPSKLDNATENAFEAISDSLGDSYEGMTSGPMLYEKDGFKIQSDETDLWVLKSPYFTYAQFCSPCAPGACYLTNPLDEPHAENKCYCLGSDWFEDEKAPYPIYSVETGELI